MKYAVIAAVAAVAVAAPADDWKPVVKTTTTADWEAYKTTTTADWEGYKTTTTADWEAYKTTTTAVWEPVKVSTKCSTVSTYTTKECGDKKGDEWENCKYVTKYTTLYPEKCATTTWAEWVPVPTTKCSSTSVYVTKECNVKKGDDSSKWEDCKDYTKTSTYYPTVCPTPVKVTETWVPIKSTETPVKAAETWSAYTTKAPVAATSSWSPVATFKGAADKQTFGMGALAIAAVAALL